MGAAESLNPHDVTSPLLNNTNNPTMAASTNGIPTLLNDTAEDSACLENYALRAAAALYPDVPASSMHIVFGRSGDNYSGEWRCGIVTRHGAGDASASLRLLEASTIEFKPEKVKGKFEEDYKEKTWMFRRILLRNLVVLLERKTYLRILKRPSEGEKSWSASSDKTGEATASAGSSSSAPPPYEKGAVELAVREK
ncbi:MAG: hypothetical protein Q9162_001350 [Coniocarpon cinnabarinum]